MIKAVIIEDELRFRESIKSKLETNFKSQVEIIGEAESVKKGIQLIEETQPDLLFLDIELKDGYSFEILAELKNYNFQLIFITGFNHLAIKAIRLGALDYILKPIDDDEFNEAVNKAILINKSETESIEPLVKVSSDFFNGSAVKRIVLKTSEAYHVINEDDLMYCKSEGNYTIFYTNNDERLMVSKNLKSTEELLTDAIFIKCHQSFLVNKFFVEKMTTDGYLILKDKTKIPVATRRKDFVISRLS